MQDEFTEGLNKELLSLDFKIDVVWDGEMIFEQHRFNMSTLEIHDKILKYTEESYTGIFLISWDPLRAIKHWDIKEIFFRKIFLYCRSHEYIQTSFREPEKSIATFFSEFMHQHSKARFQILFVLEKLDSEAILSVKKLPSLL